MPMDMQTGCEQVLLGDTDRVARDFAILRIDLLDASDLLGVCEQDVAPIISSFHTAQKRLLCKTPAADRMVEFRYTVDFDTKVRSIMSRLRLTNVKVNKSSSSVNLPTFSIKPFDGKFENWVSFIDWYEVYIHKSDLPDVKKLQYLLSSVRGLAYDLIKNYPLSDASYLVAYQVLHKYFDRERFVAVDSHKEACAQQSGTNVDNCAQLVNVISHGTTGHALGSDDVEIVSTSYDFSDKVSLEASVLPTISSEMPVGKIEFSSGHQTIDLKLAEPDFFKPGPVNRLVSDSHLASTFKPGLTGERSQPNAIPTTFGWSYNGERMVAADTSSRFRCDSENVQKNRFFVSNLTVGNPINRCRELDIVDPPEPIVLPKEEMTCANHRSSCRRSPQDRLVEHLTVAEPQDKLLLSTSNEIAFNRFLILARKSNVGLQLKTAHVDLMTIHLMNGHMEEVTPLSSNVDHLNIPYRGSFRHSLVNAPASLRSALGSSTIDSDGRTLRDFLIPSPNFREGISNFLFRSLPRGFVPAVTVLRFHGFCEASDRGYCAAIYCRAACENLSVVVRLCCATSLVAPLRERSLSWLDSMAAVILSGLMSSVAVAFEGIQSTDNILAWSDSTVALIRIKLCPPRRRAIVADGLIEIQNHLPRECWYHVASTGDLADHGSCGLLPAEFVPCEAWWSSPTWLPFLRDGWSQSSYCNSGSALEDRKIRDPFMATNAILVDDLFNRFASYKRIVNIVAYCFRYMHNLKNPQNSLFGRSNYIPRSRGMLRLSSAATPPSLRPALDAGASDADDRALTDLLPFAVDCSPRSLYRGTALSSTVLRFHGFHYAPERGYFATSHCREICESRSVGTRWWRAKSKAHLRKQSTLRLILLDVCVLPSARMTAILSSKDMASVAVSLEGIPVVDDIFAWSDPTVALIWIKFRSSCRKTIVANRVTETWVDVPPDRWHNHVAAIDSPAGQSSRKVLPADVDPNGSWWSGPMLLSLTNDEWPQSPSLLLDKGGLLRVGGRLSYNQFGYDRKPRLLYPLTHQPISLIQNRLFSPIFWIHLLSLSFCLML